MYTDFTVDTWEDFPVQNSVKTLERSSDGSKFSASEIKLLKKLFQRFNKYKQEFINPKHVPNIIVLAGQYANAETLARLDDDLKCFGMHISFEQMLNVISRYWRAPRLYEIELKLACKEFDESHDGNMKTDDLRSFLTKYGDKLTAKEGEEFCNTFAAADDAKKIEIDKFLAKINNKKTTNGGVLIKELSKKS